MSRLDRRALFTSGVAAALLSAAGMTAQAAPRRGGTLRLALQKRAAPCPVLTGAVFETLTEIGPDGILRPMLAESWSTTDAQQWQINLREGLRTHTGAMIDAERVCHVLCNKISGLRVQGTNAVNLVLDAPDPNLPWRLADPALSISDSAGQGTGLYRIKDQRAGGHFILERVERHYRDGQAGWADRVEVIALSDSAVRAEALRDGHVDVAELPQCGGLRGRFLFHPSEDQATLAAHTGVAVPAKVANNAPLDGGRIAERWGLL